jgi:hypothetical protein
MMAAHGNLTTEKLIGAAILLQQAGEHLEADETIVELAMKPLSESAFRPDYVYSKVETESVFIGLLRTAGYFVLDRDEALPAINSDPPVGEILEFPPLPFPRIWIETRDDRGPSTLVTYEGENDEDDLNILGVGIIERDPGKQWDVLMPFEFQPKGGEARGFSVIGHSITPTGFADEVDRATWNEAEGEADPATAIIGLAITAAHLITAERVPQVEIPIARPQRKRWERELKRPRFEDGPRVYFVDLKGAGEIRAEGDGSKREYRVRWIVRGHYYKHPGGKFDIPDKGKCFFRKAYVKGPIGAPWKGRPVYVGGQGTPVE